MSLSIELVGTIHRIEDTKQVSEKFRTKLVVFKGGTSQYAQYPAFQFTQDNCEKFDWIEVGKEYKFHLNIRGREYEKPEGTIMNFTNFECWKVDKIEQQAPTPTPPALDKHTPMAPAPAIPAKQVPVQQPSDQDDLPF